jgi:SAM-dependent methyltransferase
MDDQPGLALAANTGSPQTFWEQTAKTRWGQYVSEIEEEMLRAAAAAVPTPGSGLEIGCEGGRWCRLLIELGWQMTATDVDEEALRLCQARTPSLRCVLVQPSDRGIPVDSGSIDLLVCLEVPPVMNSDWFPGEAARVLKPGGQLVGSLNNQFSWRGITNRITSGLRRWDQFYSISYVAFQKSLTAAGFSIDDARGCCWAPFGRHSDSRWIPTAVALERRLGLRRLTHVSPWVVFRATRHARHAK